MSSHSSGGQSSDIGNLAILMEDVGKQYMLGQIRARTLGDDIKQRWARYRGQKNPLLKIHHEQSDSGFAESYFWALRNLDLRVVEGEILGLIGSNGAGKSTLLKLLSRITHPTEGRIRAKGRIASLLEVGTGFHPELTGRENIFLNGAILGMSVREVRNRINDIIDFSDCGPHIDTPVKRYSSGMVVRLGFAVAAHLECEILVVDEVLAVGDRAFQDRCVSKMKSVSKQSGKTIIFVSHNMAVVKQLCTSGALIRDGRATRYAQIADAISGYIDANTDPMLALSFEVKSGKPTITQISLDEAELEKGHFELEICFTSDQVFTPMGGIVLYNEEGIAVLGSNGRMHPSFQKPISTKSGSIICRYPSIPLYEGRYSVSVWLSDFDEDFDQKEHVIKFDFLPTEPVTSLQPLAYRGSINIPADWTVATSTRANEAK